MQEQVIVPENVYNSHAESEVEVWGHEAVTQITESQAIFNCLERQHSDADVERHIEYYDVTCSFLRLSMQLNPQLA